MNINSLTSRIIAPFLFEQGSIKVLLPGGFKPPHGGHLHIANQYAVNPEVAEVIVLVGPTERDGFTQEQSISIWNMLPKNPKVKIVPTKYPSPILSAYDYVFSLPSDSTEIFVLGSSNKEEDKKRSIEFAQNINGKYKTQGTKKGIKVPQGVTAKILNSPQPIVYGPRKGGGSGTPISATTLRQDIAQRNFKNFASNYPNVEPDTIKKIYNYITDGLTEMYHLPIKNIKSSQGKNPIIDLALEYNPEAAKYFRTTKSAEILLTFPDSHTAIKVKKIGNELSGRVELDLVTRDMAVDMNPEQVIDMDDDNYSGWLKKFYTQNNWVKNMIQPIDESLLLEGGAAGHMKHPFDVVSTGKELKSLFDKIVEHLKVQSASIKIDGVNVSLRVVNNQFVLDRGSMKPLDVAGVTEKDLETRFGAGHGMISIGKKVLDIFNSQFANVIPELKQLGMLDDSNLMLNMEFVQGKTNVKQYQNNFISIHNLLKIEQVAGRKKREAKPVSYNKDAMNNLINKLNQGSKDKKFEIVGNVTANLQNSPNFSSKLNEAVNINGLKPKTLGQYLDIITIPKTEKVKYLDGKVEPAISDKVFLSVLNLKQPINQVFEKESIPVAVSSFIAKYATMILGEELLKNMNSKLGTANTQEGIVISGLLSEPIKVTGRFIIDKFQTIFKK